jgi:hypothetical protein
MDANGDGVGDFEELMRRLDYPSGLFEGPFGHQRVNIADQRWDPGSLLTCPERLIRIRKEYPEFG